MSYTLHYTPGTASISSHWLLIELESHGITHTLHKIDFTKSDQKSPEYLSINPKGRVPALVLPDNKTVITESGAILLYLAQKYPEAGFAPSLQDSDKEYGRLLEMMMYITCTLLPALRDWIYAEKDGDPEYAIGVRKLAKKRILGVWDYLDTQLEGKDYLVEGEGPTVVDFLAAGTTGWTAWIEKTAMERGNVKAWVEMMRSRRSWDEMVRREGGWVKTLKGWEDGI